MAKVPKKRGKKKKAKGRRHLYADDGCSMLNVMYARVYQGSCYDEGDLGNNISGLLYFMRDQVNCDLDYVMARILESSDG